MSVKLYTRKMPKLITSNEFYTTKWGVYSIYSI